MMYRLYTLLILSTGAIRLHGQTDSLPDRSLNELVVTSLIETTEKETPLNLGILRKEQIDRTGASTLCNALQSVPGVSRLSTGQGIAKPVIRGLYGNRILTLLSSLKFDNQQWQDEHGLGLADIGIARVEVIKGPASILYGSEAVGGVLNIIEERPEPDQRRSCDAGFRLHTNTLGLSADAGWMGAKNKLWWRLRTGVDNHADYSDGSGDRVLNTRFSGYYLKSSWGIRRLHGQSVFNYNASFNQFGFVLNDLVDFFEPDGRWSRSFAGPHHNVTLNILSSQNTFFRPLGVWKINAGLQSNLRQEDEGGGAISLNMHLLSLPFNIQYIRSQGKRLEWIFTSTGSIENNTNYGARIIVPDAWMAESGISAFIRRRTERLVLEAGAGIQDKWIKTLETRGLNTPDKEIRPFSRNRASGNLLLGLAWNPSAAWSVKCNAATGYRAPNLAELSSNGLHEGIFHYEIGKPNLQNEQNLNLELNLACEQRFLAFSTAVWLNRFAHYIYLSPTGEDFFGFPVYRYQQSNADLYGTETAFSVKNGELRWTNSYALVVGKREDGENLPFITAPRLKSRLSWDHKVSPKIPLLWCFAEGEQVLEQDRPAPHETPSAAYFLLNAGLGLDLHMAATGPQISLRLVADNLLDQRYIDHLSRFKDYGLFEIGRDIVLSARVKF